MAVNLGIHEAYLRRLESGQIIQSKTTDNFLRVIFTNDPPDFQRIGYIAAKRWTMPLTEEQEQHLYQLFGRL